VAIAGAFGIVSAALLAAGRRNYPDLHTMLDTAMLVSSSALAWFMWDAGTRTRRPFPRWLAVSIGFTSIAELFHVLVSVEWSGKLAPISSAELTLRPATWPIGAFILPVGVAWSILLLRKKHRRTFGLILGLVLFSAALLELFAQLPRYSPPGWLGITRPLLILVPCLWIVVGWSCWRLRNADRLLAAIVPMAALFAVAHTAMLYSRAPHDTEAMVAHVGCMSAYLMLLLSKMRMASSDMLETIRAEEALAGLNQELEQRVEERTSELASANLSLHDEVDVRRQAEARLQAHLARLHLLQQITHAIAERQDLRSIFRVVVRRVRNDLPVDFACICDYDQATQSLEVVAVGSESESLVLDLAMEENARFPIDENGLARCVSGQLIYEPDIGGSSLPFPERLEKAGLRSMVMAPLSVEAKVFGVLLAARREAEAFSSGDCEFLRQLSEHTALATHQAQIYTALGQAYEDLKQTQQAVMQQERLRALGQMASGIAHDINNAMSPVLLYTELLRREPGLSENGRKYLETISRAVSDVGQTIARLTEFYREREPQLTFVPLQVNELVRQVVDLTRARWRDIPLQRGIVIRVATELENGLPPVAGVESELREALINLVFNAVDAMPDGGTLTLRTGEEGPDVTGSALPRQVYVEVIDTGIGMDEDTRRRCLEPFFTTKGERGTGLGLAMVYGIVKRQNARIDIDSLPNRGTTMRLTFTVPAVTTAAPGSLTDQPVPTPQRILLIDDDPLVLNALRDTLAADGHTVTTASGGQQGIDTFRAVRPPEEMFTVVITDLGMPYVGGRDVASAIKEISPSTPIILLTGWGQRLAAEGEIPPHIDRMLSKPPALDKLRATLAELTSSSRA
jgi:signal transduction histidine kinase/ActR/RegA family two-component response regulator